MNPSPRVLIASFGSKDIIQRTMDLHRFHVHEVLTPGDYHEEGYEDRDSMDDKNRMIQDACEKHGCQRPFLVDDSLSNIQALPSTTLGFQVQGTQGLTREDARMILEQVAKAGCDAVFIDADLTLFAEHVTSKYYYPLLEAGLGASDFDVSQVILADGADVLLRGLQPPPPPFVHAGDVAAVLRQNTKAADAFKTSPAIPIEKLPPLSEFQQAFFDSIPVTSHARDHVFGLNDEQIRLVEDTVAGRQTHHGIVEEKYVAYGGGIRQVKRRLDHKIISRRVYVPLSLNPILHRRHAATPGVDFIVRYSKALAPYLEEVDTQVITVRTAEDGTPVVGTTYAGNHLPGSDDPTDIAGILYKWYPATEEGDAKRAADAARFCDAVEKEGRVCALIDARDYQQLVLEN